MQIERSYEISLILEIRPALLLNIKRKVLRGATFVSFGKSSTTCGCGAIERLHIQPWKSSHSLVRIMCKLRSLSIENYATQDQRMLFVNARHDMSLPQWHTVRNSHVSRTFHLFYINVILVTQCI